MTREHKTAIILLMLIVALYPWAMDSHNNHEKKPLTLNDLKPENREIDEPSPTEEEPSVKLDGGGYDAWESSVIPLKNTEN